MKTLGDVGAGHTLGRYDLLTPIAQGGMALVWAARLRGSRGFQKIVAVKAMLPSLAEDSKFEEMFMAEAELSSRIKHPNVCEIFDVGEEDGTPYIVMEWVNGEPLSALLKVCRQAHKVIPRTAAIRIVRDAALGLHAAHEVKNEDGHLCGIVHRDVSPQNLLIGYDGHVKVVDFGIAKATEEGQSKKTEAGQVKGKVQYMAPEQALGRADRRSDIFALGIVLYLLLTMKHPFEAETELDTLRKICGPVPARPPSSIVKELPPSVDAVLARALHKTIEKRYQTMQEFADALEKLRLELLALAATPGAPPLSGDANEVGPFITEMLGIRGEKRKKAIKEAMRLADERAVERQTSISGTAHQVAVDMLRATNPSGISGISSPSLASISQPSDITGPPVPSSSGLTPPTFGPASSPSGSLGVPHFGGSDAGVSADNSVQPAKGSRAPLFAVGGIGIAAAAAAAIFFMSRGDTKKADTKSAAGQSPATATAQIATARPTASTAGVDIGSLPNATATSQPSAEPTAEVAVSKGTPTRPVNAPIAHGGTRPPAGAPTPGPVTAPPTGASPPVPKIRDPGF